MTGNLQILAGWERLDAGPLEERACFAAINIVSGNGSLTEAEDRELGRVRQEIPLSAYKLAEWLAWNWWRLRWEPRKQDAGWALSHQLTSIGDGYVWPNVTVISDGERVALIAKPTDPRVWEPVRYIADYAVMVRAAEYESAVQRFIAQVCEQLRAKGVADTNLALVWDEVLSERADPSASHWRRLEAMLGFDPDEAEPATIEGLIADAESLGVGAIEEVAAARAEGGEVVTGENLRRTASENGFPSRPGDMTRLSDPSGLPPLGAVVAWRRGADAARALRAQEGLGDGPLPDVRLAELMGVQTDAVTGDKAAPDFGFALDDEANAAGRVVLRSRWRDGRRFELARLLGDRIAGNYGELLSPATRRYTYRQKLQRSFAAELLCPFGSLDDFMGDDLSEESIGYAADHFEISDLAVRTILVNHGRFERDELDGDFDAAAA